MGPTLPLPWTDFVPILPSFEESPISLFLGTISIIIWSISSLLGRTIFPARLCLSISSSDTKVVTCSSFRKFTWWFMVSVCFSIGLLLRTPLADILSVSSGSVSSLKTCGIVGDVSSNSIDSCSLTFFSISICTPFEKTVFVLTETLFLNSIPSCSTTLLSMALISMALPASTVTTPISSCISKGSLAAASFTITLSISSPAMVSLIGWIGVELSSTVSRGFSSFICWYATSSFADMAALLISLSSLAREPGTTLSSLSCTAAWRELLPNEILFCVCSSLLISMDPCNSCLVTSIKVSVFEVPLACIFSTASHFALLSPSFSPSISSSLLSSLTLTGLVSTTSFPFEESWISLSSGATSIIIWSMSSLPGRTIFPACLYFSISSAEMKPVTCTSFSTLAWWSIVSAWFSIGLWLASTLVDILSASSDFNSSLKTCGTIGAVSSNTINSCPLTFFSISLCTPFEKSSFALWE